MTDERLVHNWINSLNATDLKRVATSMLQELIFTDEVRINEEILNSDGIPAPYWEVSGDPILG